MTKKKELNIWFPATLSYNPVREDTYTQAAELSSGMSLGKKFSGYSITMYTNGFRLEQLIPNYFRYVMHHDTARIPSVAGVRPALVTR